MDLRQWIDKSSPVWMRRVLWLAAVFNIYWGGKLMFREATPPATHWPFGLLVLVLGIGYVLAGFRPRRHWAIVFVGLLFSVLGPVGYWFSGGDTELPWSGGWAIFFYHILWWVPFVLILRKAWEPRPPRRRGPPRGRLGRRFEDGGRPDRRPRASGQGSGSGSGSAPSHKGSRQQGHDPRRRRRRRGPRRDGDRGGGPPPPAS